jgi:HIV Tat-specific factor 1
MIFVLKKNPAGVATVSFKSVDDADNCCEYLNDRVWKNGRIITCETWDGKTKYDVEETEEERQTRLDEWHKFIEAEEEEENEEGN